MGVATHLPVRDATMLEDFVSRTLVVPVRPASDSEPGALLQTTPEKAELLRRVVARSLSAANEPQGVDAMCDALFRVDLARDLWYVQMPDGALVVLAQQDTCDLMPEREIAHRVHADVIELSHAKGEMVSPELLQWSRQLLGCLGARDQDRMGS